MRTKALGLVAAGGLVLANVGHTEAPPDKQKAAAEAALRPVAFLYNGAQTITAQELGEFLMARGGADKLDLLVNRTIIERAAAAKGVTVTDAEMTAALEEDLKGFGFDKTQFVKVALASRGKSLYEWMEDVIRPRIMLSKMCIGRVQVTEEALRVQFERQYGEKRRVQLILWPPNDDKQAILKTWEKIRGSQEEFDRAARMQANPALAAAAGFGRPISRYMPAEERIVEEIAFQLHKGEVSQILHTKLGYVCIKMHDIIKPADVKYEDVKAGLHHQAQEELLSAEIPKFFAELKEKADPKLVYTGPSQWQQLDVRPESGQKLMKDAGLPAAKK
jgi:hypothetical protein